MAKTAEGKPKILLVGIHEGKYIACLQQRKGRNVEVRIETAIGTTEAQWSAHRFLVGIDKLVDNQQRENLVIKDGRYISSTNAVPEQPAENLDRSMLETIYYVLDQKFPEEEPEEVETELDSEESPEETVAEVPQELVPDF